MNVAPSIFGALYFLKISTLANKIASSGRKQGRQADKPGRLTRQAGQVNRYAWFNSKLFLEATNRTNIHNQTADMCHWSVYFYGWSTQLGHA